LTGIQKELKILCKRAISYLFGAFFLFMSLGSFGLHHYTAGILFFLASSVTIPLAVNQLKKKTKITISGITQFFIVFLLVATAFAAIPVAPSATNSTFNNSKMIATSPSSVNGNEIISVPANLTQVATKNPVSKQNIISTATPSQTSTSIIENKGKLDILTSPTGATIIIDGVSKGISPIEGLSVDAGTHTVEAYLSGYSLQKEKVEISNSETKKLFYTLILNTNLSTTSTGISTSESTKAQATTLDSKTTTTSDTNKKNSISNYKESKSTATTTSDTNKKNSVSNYKESKSTAITTSDTNNTDNELIYASSKSDVYHAERCRYVERIKPENFITFKSRKEAEAAGYRACKVCGG
jgi:hypothetical protein